MKQFLLVLCFVSCCVASDKGNVAARLAVLQNRIGEKVAATPVKVGRDTCCHSFTVSGLENTIQGPRMGVYTRHASNQTTVMYQNKGTKEFIFFYNHDRWLIGPTPGSDDCGIFMIQNNLCPTPLTDTFSVQSKWFNGEKFEKGEIRITCITDEVAKNFKLNNKITYAQLITQIDPAKTGVVEASRLSSVFGISEEQAKSILLSPGLDMNNDKVISPTELARYWDKNNSGYLNVREIASGLVVNHDAMKKAQAFLHRVNKPVTSRSLPATPAQGPKASRPSKEASKKPSNPSKNPELDTLTPLTVSFQDFLRFFDSNGDSVVTIQDISAAASLFDTAARNAMKKISGGSETEATSEQLKTALKSTNGEVSLSSIADVFFAGNMRNAKNLINDIISFTEQHKIAARTMRKASDTPEHSKHIPKPSKNIPHPYIAIPNTENVPKRKATLIATSVTVEQIRRFFDVNGDGLLSRSEMANGAGLYGNDLNHALQKINGGIHEEISFDSLIAALKPTNGVVTIESIANILFEGNLARATTLTQEITQLRTKKLQIKPAVVIQKGEKARKQAPEHSGVEAVADLKVKMGGKAEKVKQDLKTEEKEMKMRGIKLAGKAKVTASGGSNSPETAKVHADVDAQYAKTVTKLPDGAVEHAKMVRGNFQFGLKSKKPADSGIVQTLKNVSAGAQAKVKEFINKLKPSSKGQKKKSKVSKDVQTQTPNTNPNVLESDDM